MKIYEDITIWEFWVEKVFYKNLCHDFPPNSEY